MTTFTFNSAKVSDRPDFSAIPEGNYECFIESGVSKVAASGTKYIDFKIKVRDDVKGQAHGGRVLFGKLFFTEKTEGIVHGFLKAIDTPEGKDFGEDYINAIKDYATGKAILAVVGQREYKGEIQNEVKYMNASKVGGGRVDSPFDTVASNDDPFATDAPIEISDDDLPF